MLPKNNRTIFSDNSNAPNGNQQQRPVSVNGIPSYNSNLIVTPQQQPIRSNATFQLNSPINSGAINQMDVAKHLVASMQQQQNTQSHNMNRTSQSPLQVTPSQSPQILRPPQTSQADSVSMNNIYQALCLIQQNLHQADKNKVNQNSLQDVCRPVVLSSPSISLNSPSQNHSATVLAMSSSDIQLLELISRLSSQQASKQVGPPNVSLIQPDSVVAQHLLNLLQKQSQRPATTISSPSFMVIGQASKPVQSQINYHKDAVNISHIPSHSSANDLSNSVIPKMSINSKVDIPWIKLLDKLPDNPENMADINRSYKARDSKDSPRNLGTMLMSQTRQTSKESMQRNNDSGNNSLNSTAMQQSSKTDTRQILRDSKAISYLMPINNEDMVNQHFQQSLREKLDTKRPFHHTNGNLLDVSTARNKSNRSFIDLDRPEFGSKHNSDNSVCVSAPSQISSSVYGVGNKITIKDTADALVEDLIKRSLNTNFPVNKQKLPSPYSSNVTHCHVLDEVSSSGYQTLINTRSDNVVIKPSDSLINSTSTLKDNNSNAMKLTNIRPNPSKSDLPLKKRIMLDFNEHINTYQDCDLKSNIVSDEPPIKQRNKRTHTDSVNSDTKTDSSPQDPSVPITKKRRGRIPGTGKNQKLKEECRLKEIAKINESGNEESWRELMRTIVKPPDLASISDKTLTHLDLSSLKLSKKAFFQIGSCMEIAPKMVKCRSCRQSTGITSTSVTSNIESSSNIMDDVSSVRSGSKDSSNTTAVSSFCRFHGFRKLQFSAKGSLTQAGFCRSNEADSQDLSLWRMYHPLSSELSISVAKHLMVSLSSIFCEIIDTENRFLQESYEVKEYSENRASKKPSVNVSTVTNKVELDGFVWKRPVPDVREMCDVCDTSIFNTHWACRKCGYSVCVDCFQERQDVQSTNDVKLSASEREIDCLQKNMNDVIKNAVHQNTRGATKNLFFSCDHPWSVCTANRQQHNPDQMLKVELIPIRVINELRNRMHTVARLMQIKLKCNCLSRSEMDLKRRLSKQMSLESIPVIANDNMSTVNCDLHMLADIALKEVVNTGNKGTAHIDDCVAHHPTTVLRPPPVLSPPHDPENGNYSASTSNELRLSETNSSSFSWISVNSNFKMMHLHTSQNVANLKLFQQEWHNAHPVIVSGCHEVMDRFQWTPENFLEEFESDPSLLIDCGTGLPVTKETMKTFWDGFTSRSSTSETSSRLMCLKLKDWPPLDDFNDTLPQKCEDTLSNLPIKEYTGRQGEYNLSSHVPEFFVCPDAGPKLYNAYGVPRESKCGTINLHLNIADTVNVLLYIAEPHDHEDIDSQNCLYSMHEAMLDDQVLTRAEYELPGSLWHIFLPKDVPLLRQFLVELLLERGEYGDSNKDPIYDEKLYLNQTLLDRLKIEKNVQSCAFVQFRGDAVFIPAGSPHQIRNLHSCMMMASDFVSPENVHHCLQVTKELRQRAPSDGNNGDNLQAKNMIFHAVKDAVSTLIIKCSLSATEMNSKQKDYRLKRKRVNEPEATDKLLSSSKTEKCEKNIVVGHSSKDEN